MHNFCRMLMKSTFQLVIGRASLEAEELTYGNSRQFLLGLILLYSRTSKSRIVITRLFLMLSFQFFTSHFSLSGGAGSRRLLRLPRSISRSNDQKKSPHNFVAEVVGAAAASFAVT